MKKNRISAKKGKRTRKKNKRMKITKEKVQRLS